MKTLINFSLTLWLGVVLKEMNELRRDRVSLCMAFMTPLFQLIIIGYAVNLDPHRVPTALLNYDTERMSEVFVTASQNTDYFSIIPMSSEQEARKVFVRGEKPQILLEGDAIDPITTGNALSAIVQMSKDVFQHDWPDSVRKNSSDSGDFDLVIHRMFNPESISQYSTIPAIIGSILSTTLILMTALSITRERENGAMENLLITPVTGLEVILGKITPYVMIGMFQSLIILAFSVFMFNIPLLGNVFLLLFILMTYIFLCLSIGITISSVAHSQLQALQMSSFYFVPSLMLSGFISPFISMPVWAQAIGAFLPLTYFIRLIKGVMLKGYTMMEMLP